MAAATALTGFGSVSSAPAKQIIPDAGVFAQTTIAGSVQGDSPSLYVPYIGKRAAASIVAEGAAINESDTKPLELAIRTQKVAVLNVFSNESGAQSAASNGNVGGSGIDVVGMLTDGMKKTIIDKANAILWQNPAPTEGKPETAPTGLFNYPGIIQGGNITNTLDPIVDAIASISTNGGAPTGLVMNYGVWAYLLKLRDAEGRLIISPDVANTPTPALFGLPVHLDGMAPDGKILVNSIGDVYSATGDINIARTDDRYFERDSFGVRLTFRFGWGVPYPDHLAVITVNKK